MGTLLLLLRLPIDRVHPIVLGGVLPKLGLMVGDASPETDCSVGVLVGAANSLLGKAKITGDLGEIR